MKQIPVILLSFMLASCGDDAIVYRPGESTAMKIIALASENQIFVQGEKGVMSKAEFDNYLSRLLSGEKEYSFVIQSNLGPSSEATKGIVQIIHKHGIPTRHIAVAKSNH